MTVFGAGRAELGDEFAARFELLDAVVVGVGYPDVALGVDRQGFGAVELAVFGALGAELGDELAAGAELLHPGDETAAGLHRPDVAGGVERDAAQAEIEELAVAGARAAELGQVVAFGVELLHPRVAGVGDVDVVFGVDRDGAGRGESAVGGAFAAELTDESARGAEDLDAVVVGVGDPDVAFGVDGGVGGGGEVAGTRAGAAEVVEERGLRRRCRCG